MWSTLQLHTHDPALDESVRVRMLSGGKWHLALWVLAARCNQMFLEMTSCPLRWSWAPFEIKTSLAVMANAVLINWPGWAEFERLSIIDAIAWPLRNAILKTLLLSLMDEQTLYGPINFLKQWILISQMKCVWNISCQLVFVDCKCKQFCFSKGMHFIFFIFFCDITVMHVESISPFSMFKYFYLSKLQPIQ